MGTNSHTDTTRNIIYVVCTFAMMMAVFFKSIPLAIQAAATLLYWKE